MPTMPETRQTNLSADQINARIRFLDEDEVMECDFSDLHLETQQEVNTFYDHLEDRIHDTGFDKWFFLVNYSNSRIDPDAWIAFAQRGKSLNRAHSQGSVRFDVSETTRRQIERDAGTENFDPGLFATRKDALEKLRSLTSQRRARVVHDPNYTTADFLRRITFHSDEDIMEVDFENFTFWHSGDVNDFYDHVEERVKATDQKWFFLVNLNNCRIMPEAWVQYARRGKALNAAASLGSVRFAAGSETEAEIRQRAQSQDFRPNIRNTREEALARLAELKSQDR